VSSTASSLLTTLPHLDILVCNAGIMALPPSLSPDGYEIQFATNHLGHALLIKKLLPLLRKSEDPRVILVSSESFRGAPADGILFDTLKTPQDMPLGRFRRYAQSKLANLLYARELARRVPEVLSFSVTPGVVNTAMVRETSFLEKAVVYLTTRVQSVEEGTWNLLWAVGVEKDEVEGGAFYGPGIGVKNEMGTKTRRDDSAAENLWEWTEGELEGWM
jgi:NAD(P)-dependent dehydrogenase (short-subunit alcohol dehydrogenase family)